MPSTRPFDLVAFDLDGTTIPHAEKFMPQRTKRAFALAHQRGCVVAAVTGRPVDMLSFIYDEPWMDYLVTLNGSLVRRASSASGRAELFGAPLAPTQSAAVFQALAGLCRGWFAFLHDAEYMERNVFSYMVNLSGASAEEMRTHFPGTELVDSVPALVAAGDFAGVYKIQCSFGDRQERDEGARRLEALGGLELARMGDREIEVTTAGANKGDALVRLAGALGIDPARGVAFGDDGNDLAMAGKVGSFVAVANASEKILAAADEVCPSVDECGVATWLEQRLA
jgi:Cof subfamily protein (haloacid dehalogenase superfamily)